MWSGLKAAGIQLCGRPGDGGGGKLESAESGREELGLRTIAKEESRC